jgi:four helix bundle protein
VGKEGFQGLKVWQKSKKLAVQVYRVTDHGVLKNDYGLRDQIRRSGVSIPSNIAEGDERDTDKEAVRHFYIAKGSAAELLTQLIIAREIGYIDEPTFIGLEENCIEGSRMLSKLISARSKTFSR